MGNAVDKSRGKGYYGLMGEGVLYEEAEGFLVVSLTPAGAEETLPEKTADRKTMSPFGECRTTDERKTNLEGSVDSGYAETHATANNFRSRESSPEHIPGRPLEDDETVGMDIENNGLIERDCRTAKSLGNCHAYLGFRFYHYNDCNCEGNKHIVDEDL